MTFGGNDAPGRFTQFVTRRLPTRDRAKHPGRFPVEILEDAAQELADDERVHQGGLSSVSMA
jgi:hypothetical protein